jgi:hypothetical protein
MFYNHLPLDSTKLSRVQYSAWKHSACSGDFRELILVQLVKKVTAFLNSNFHCCIYDSTPIVPTVNPTTSVHNLVCHSFANRCNITRPTEPSCYNSLFPSSIVHIYQLPRPCRISESRRLTIEAAWVWARGKSCGICGGQSGTGAGFLTVLRFHLSRIHFTNCCKIIYVYHPGLVQ